MLKEPDGDKFDFGLALQNSNAPMVEHQFSWQRGAILSLQKAEMLVVSIVP